MIIILPCVWQLILFLYFICVECKKFLFILTLNLSYRDFADYKDTISILLNCSLFLEHF